MKPRRLGFTLIELLVVIAILATLATTFFPIMLRAEEQGRVTTCSSNLRQIYSALTMYCDQWNGFIPDARPINFYATFEWPGQPIQIYPAKRNDPDNPTRQIKYLLLTYILGKPLNTQASYNIFDVLHCPSDKIVPPLKNGKFDKSSSLYAQYIYPKFGSSYQ